jgi:hypothetical protein
MGASVHDAQRLENVSGLLWVITACRLPTSATGVNSPHADSMFARSHGSNARAVLSDDALVNDDYSVGLLEPTYNHEAIPPVLPCWLHIKRRHHRILDGQWGRFSFRQRAGGNSCYCPARSRCQGRSPQGPRNARRLDAGEHRTTISPPPASSSTHRNRAFTSVKSRLLRVTRA